MATFPFQPATQPASAASAPTGAAAGTALIDARRLRRQICGFAAAIILAFLITAAMFAWRSYEQALSEADRLAINLTTVLEEQANRAFGATDFALQQVAESLERQLADGQALGPSIVDLLRGPEAALPEVTNLVVLDSAGRIVAGTSPSLQIGADRSERPPFQAFADDTFRDMFIGAPLVGVDTAEVFLPVSRRFSRPDGQLGGIVTAGLSPEAIRAFYLTLDLGPNGAARLFLRDGTAVVREPYDTDLVGESFAHLSLFRYRLEEAPRGLYRATFASDGILRHAGFAALPNYPLVVSAAVARQDVLRSWYDVLALIGAVGAVFIPSILLLLGLMLRQISRRLEAELEVARSAVQVRSVNDRLTEAIESISEGFVLYGPDQRLVIANSRARDMMPYAAPLLVPGTHRRDLIRAGALHHPQRPRFGSLDAYIEAELQRRRQPRPPFETHLADGRWVRTVDHATRHGGIVSIRQDITEARKANAGLADFSDKLQALTAAALVVTASLDSREVLDFITDEARKIVGSHQSFAALSKDGNWQRAAIAKSLSQKYANWWQQPLPEGGAQFCADLCRGSRAVHLTQEQLASHPVWQRFDMVVQGGPPLRGCLAVPLTDREGATFGFILLSDKYDGDFTDTDEVLLTQFARIAAMALDNARLVEELRHTEQQLRDAQRLARLGSWELGPRDLVMDWSPEMFEIFGRDPAKGNPDLDEALAYLLPEDRDRTRQELQQAFEDQTTAQLGFRLRRESDGEIRECRVEGRGVVNSEGRSIGLVGIVQDITDRKRIEEQLHQAQKMEAVGQLTGGVAHDFNNLLTVILGNAEMLQAAMTAQPRQRMMVDIILRAATRGAELTQRLLAFSRRQALEPTVLDLADIVTDLQSLIRRTLGESVRVESQVPPDLWLADADPAQLEAALVNLAINARDAMPQGGLLTISLENLTLPPDAVPSGPDGLVPGDYVVLTVADTGAGMEPEVLKRCLEPFFTTKAVGKGSGLGLSMAYGFARQSGGTLTVASDIGQGTTVRLYLPRSAAGESAGDDSALPAPGDDVPRGQGEHVLVVEDDEFVRRYAIEQLQALGYRVTAAADGTAALAALHDCQDVADNGFDLMFTDIVMPGMDGRELARQVAALWPDLKVLYTSGYSENVNLDGSAGRGGRVMLHKPYRARELATKLRQVLGNAP